MKTLVVLPSYNERENLVRLIEAILQVSTQIWICVVDDSSPDGTSEVVREAIATRPGWPERVWLITRSKKDGRGGAVRAGFAHGVASGHDFECFIEMDCDFSHEPAAIPTGLALRQTGADVVIGARYPDGTIEGWPVGRRLFSFFANVLARSLIVWSIADYTNGFRFYSARAVAILLRHPQRHRGYVYLSESLSYLLRAGMTIECFPIHFKNRERGISNTSLSEIRAALKGIFSIALNHHFGRFGDNGQHDTV
jgi:dolichol-phosphate mannosyltransferase